jgi:hypothetical protein
VSAYLLTSSSASAESLFIQFSDAAERPEVFSASVQRIDHRSFQKECNEDVLLISIASAIDEFRVRDDEQPAKIPILAAITCGIRRIKSVKPPMKFWQCEALKK